MSSMYQPVEGKAWRVYNLEGVPLTIQLDTEAQAIEICARLRYMMIPSEIRLEDRE